MRRLILLRHAKSSWADPGASDHDRPLNRRGEEAAPRIGGYLNRHGLIPQCVLCSTAVRARATWELAGVEIAAAPPPHFDERLYNASARTILDVLRDVAADAAVVLVVGHNPGLQDAATQLIASGNPDDRERLREKLPTGALVVIDFPVAQWAKARSGRLERFVVPRTLAATTD